MEARLTAEQMPLTLCPLSNLKLRVIKDMKDYPLKAMMAKGLMCTLNSDDPAYFGGYLSENYEAVHNAIGLTKEEITELAKNSFQASYLSDFEKQIYLDEVEKFYLENRW